MLLDLFKLGVLFPELLVSLLILSIGVDGFSSICQTSKLETPKFPSDLKSNKNLCLGLGFLRRANFVKPLITLLETLNSFNRLAPSCDIEDTEALSWPGIIGTSLINTLVADSPVYTSLKMMKSPLSELNISFEKRVAITSPNNESER